MNEDRAQKFQTLKTMLPLILILLSLCNSCAFFRQEAEFLIPAGYEGSVIVLFNQPDGIELEKNTDGTIIYRIPADGFLKIKNVFERKNYKFNYFYVDSQNSKIRLEYLYPRYYVRDPGDTTSKSFDRISEEENNKSIFVINHRNSNFNTKDGRVFLQDFIVGKPKDADTILNQSETKISKIQRQILGIPEPSF